VYGRHVTPADESSEAGLTLIELLVVSALLGLIAIALSTSIIVGLTSFGGADNRVHSSTDAQLLSLYLPADLQSAGANAGDVVVDGAHTQSVPQGAFVTESGNTECSGLPNLLLLRWKDDLPGNNDPSYLVSYALVQDGTRWKLNRYDCGYQLPTRMQRLVSNLNGNAIDDARVTVDGPKVTLQLRDRSVPRGDPVKFTYSISGFLRSAG
jgi:prepilin-type N-terminal cleavage/methylation domain-containing protein